MQCYTKHTVRPIYVLAVFMSVDTTRQGGELNKIGLLISERLKYLTWLLLADLQSLSCMLAN